MEKSFKFAKFSYKSLYPFVCSELRLRSTAVTKSITNEYELNPIVHSPSTETTCHNNNTSCGSSEQYGSWMFSRDTTQRLKGFERVKQWYRNHQKRIKTQTSLKNLSIHDEFQDMRVVKYRAELSKYALKCTAMINTEKEKQVLTSKVSETKEGGRKTNKENKQSSQSNPTIYVTPKEVTEQLLVHHIKQEPTKNDKQESKNDVKQEKDNVINVINTVDKNNVDLLTVEAIDEVSTIPSWLAHYELCEFYKKFDRFQESERADNKYLKKKKTRKSLPKVFEGIYSRPSYRC